MQGFINFVMDHKEALLAGALFIWSEVLGSSEKFKASSLYELVLNILKRLTGKQIN